MKLPISSFDEPVSEPVTIISARDASASENSSFEINRDPCNGDQTDQGDQTDEGYQTD